MGTLVTAGAVNTTMPCRIAVQCRAGIHFSNTGMTGNTLGFIHPGDLGAIRYGRCQLRHGPVAGDTIAVESCVCQRTVALRIFSRRAIGAGDGASP